MSTDKEQQRLRALYSAMDDTELIRLSEKRADLTEEAQDALKSELAVRSLTVAEANEADHSFIAADSDKMVVVLEVSDISRAQTIRDLFARHELAVSLRAFPSPGGDGYYWMLSVPETELSRAAELIQANKRLIPQPEQIEAHPDSMPGEDDRFIVAEFTETHDAQTAREALEAAGVPFTEYELGSDDEPLWTFEVAQNDVERAGEVLENALQTDADA